MSNRIGPSVRRSTSSGSFRVDSVLAQDTDANDHWIVSVVLFDADGEFLRRAVGDNFDTMVRIGNTWLHELAIADAEARNDKSAILALTSTPLWWSH